MEYLSYFCNLKKTIIGGCYTANKKSPFTGASGWSVGDSNSRPLPCEGSALNQLS